MKLAFSSHTILPTQLFPTDSLLALPHHGVVGLSLALHSSHTLKQRKLQSFTKPKWKNGVVAFSGSAGSSADDPDKRQSVQLYGQIERVIVDTAKRTQGTPGRWQEIQGAWVLWPIKGEPIAIVHFIGGVFVGATPQLTYRLFLECLSERGFLVIATPFASGFDHLRIADEAQFKFDRCIRAMRNDFVESLPIFGVGHSLGSLIHLLICSRYAVQRAGNVFLSFNNQGASKSIPLFSPVVVPMAQNLGPLLAQFMSSPTIRLGAEMAIKQFENLSPPLLKQVLPLVEQLQPLYMELANGKDSFTPSVGEASQLIKSYYFVGRNLLIRFKDDVIDETPELAQMLSSYSAVSSHLDMSVRTLPGDHTRPLQQVFPQVPSVMADAVSRGGELLTNLAAGTPWATVAKEMSQSLGMDPTTQHFRLQIIEDIEKLVDEVAGWIIPSLKST
ncbi:hypothetical protein O6H91_05G096600 [Diphasiastrum complanatum]|uniref:Uncharacterized protein n=1 Tax=Diphasiastrum complanatum TaxID=34168 RepID=A0ACC2DRG0_DIPCM|nr:hypothetical protein O6H91_05G096600 [Diphasiastrum complanatum]